MHWVGQAAALLGLGRVAFTWSRAAKRAWMSSDKGCGLDLGIISFASVSGFIPMCSSSRGAGFCMHRRTTGHFGARRKTRGGQKRQRCGILVLLNDGSVGLFCSGILVAPDGLFWSGYFRGAGPTNTVVRGRKGLGGEGNGLELYLETRRGSGLNFDGVGWRLWVGGEGHASPSRRGERQRQHRRRADGGGAETRPQAPTNPQPPVVSSSRTNVLWFTPGRE